MHDIKIVEKVEENNFLFKKIIILFFSHSSYLMLDKLNIFYYRNIL